MEIHMSVFSGYPQCICASTDRPDVIYTLSKNYYVRKNDLGDTSTCVEFLLRDSDDTYVVVKGEAEANSDDISPVYVNSGGLLLIPTGRIFVRLKDNILIESRSEDFLRLGYVITCSPSYAPNTGWLEQTDKNTAKSLRNISALARLPIVQNVEPQMLTIQRMR